MELKRAVKIECEGAATVPLDALVEFQGNLKSLSDERATELEREILLQGFSYVVHVWKDPEGTLFILDGHQRTRVLKKLRDDGYKIPPIPVSFVHARNAKQASEKLLAAVAQYGTVEKDGLYEYANRYELDLQDIIKRFPMPEIDGKKFLEEFTDALTEKDGGREIGEDEMSQFDHECPKCGFKF